jgi:hypothetical protein
MLNLELVLLLAGETRTVEGLTLAPAAQIMA